MDIKNIESLLAEKKYDEVRAIINEAVNTKFSETEKGAALAGLASAYMDISNTVNIQYLEALKEAVSGMKKINTAEARSNDNIKLVEIRSKL